MDKWEYNIVDIDLNLWVEERGMSQIKPTKEQASIVARASKGVDLVVQARAGTGKTSNLQMLATYCPKDTTYLTYNTSMAKEAKARFPSHVKCMTGHALAFRATITRNGDLEAKFKAASNGSRIPMYEIAREFGINAEFGMTTNQLSAAVLRIVQQFQYSSDRDIDERHVPAEIFPSKMKKAGDAVLADAQDYLLTVAQRMWRRMSNTKDSFPILHDTYLKLYQLSNTKINGELIMLDEAQDTNPVLQAIVNAQDHMQKVRVGDDYQQIYSWRGATNALAQAAGERMHLTNSFRFGQDIAGLANIILQARGETNLMKGLGPEMKAFNPKLPYTVIARNNMTMFEAATGMMEQGKKLAIVGGVEDIVNLIESAYALYQGRMHEVRSSELKFYRSWQELSECAQLSGDASLMRLVRLIDKYKHESLTISGQLRDYAQLPEAHADVILSTAHKAKGREWRQTLLTDDLMIADETLTKIRKGDELSEEENESLNLLYVAMTRGKEAMHLTADIKSQLRQLQKANERKLDAKQEETQHMRLAVG